MSTLAAEGREATKSTLDELVKTLVLDDYAKRLTEQALMIAYVDGRIAELENDT
jgi:hypothetical protein